MGKVWAVGRRTCLDTNDGCHDLFEGERHCLQSSDAMCSVGQDSEAERIEEGIDDKEGGSKGKHN